MRYLFDSDWIIDALHGKARARDQIAALRSDGIAISVITLAEVSESAYRSPDPARELAAVRQLLEGFRTINVTPSVARRFAQERADLRRRGALIADFDLLISATALRYGLTPVTRNLSHFDRIPNLLIHQQDQSKAISE